MKAVLCPQVSAGGSLANSIVGVARLGLAKAWLTNSGPLRMGMLSVAGSDAQVRPTWPVRSPSCMHHQLMTGLHAMLPRSPHEVLWAAPMARQSVRSGWISALLHAR